MWTRGRLTARYWVALWPKGDRLCTKPPVPSSLAGRAMEAGVRFHPQKAPWGSRSGSNYLQNTHGTPGAGLVPTGVLLAVSLQPSEEGVCSRTCLVGPLLTPCPPPGCLCAKRCSPPHTPRGVYWTSGEPQAQDGPGGERNKGQATSPVLTVLVLCSQIHLLTEVRLGLQIHARGRASVAPPRGASPGPRGDTASCVSSAVTRGFLEVYEKLSFLHFCAFFFGDFAA